MNHREFVVKSRRAWQIAAIVVFVLALAACGTTPPTSPNQGDASISAEEAEAAVMKLQVNAGIETASTQNLSALSDQQLADAWSGLSEREQKAAELFLKPSSEETGVIEDSSHGGNLDTQARGCYYRTRYRYAKNVFGKKLWQYNQRQHWCSNGSYLTSARRELWGNTYWIGWSYRGENSRYIAGGRGYTYYTANTSGHFRYGTGPWDVQHQYPRINSTVYR